MNERRNVCVSCSIPDIIINMCLPAPCTIHTHTHTRGLWERQNDDVGTPKSMGVRFYRISWTAVNDSMNIMPSYTVCAHEWKAGGRHGPYSYTIPKPFVYEKFSKHKSTRALA